MKYPSYLVRHENKVVWLIHQFRQAYDRFGTAESDFTASPEDTRWRELIAESDRTSLTEARKIFTNARNTADRLARFNGIEAEALYHPPPLAGRYRCEGSRGFALVAGRPDPRKGGEFSSRRRGGGPGRTPPRGPRRQERRCSAIRRPRRGRGAAVALCHGRRRDPPPGGRGLRVHRPRGVPVEKARGDLLR